MKRKPLATGSSPKNKRKIVIAVEIAVLLVLILSVLCLEMYLSKPQETAQEPPTEAATVQVSEEETVIATVPVETSAPTEPVVTEPQVLSYLAEKAEQNSDMVGWIKIDDTKLNYPLMFTPYDEEKYIHRDFEGNYSVAGLPFIDADCSLEPRTDNLIIYGHNMLNGSMFATLMNYENEDYWKKHPVIYLSSLYEETAYEVVAAFRDRIYYTYEDAFRFYRFIDAENEEDFDYAISQFKEKSCYDTGITPQYGDHLITLVTCAYHTDDGRFVVVARAVSENNEAQTATDNE